MAKIWLEERLSIFIPALQPLGTAQEDEIARLCEAEIANWRGRSTMKKPGSLRPVMTATRKAIKQRIELTAENSWKNPRSGQYEHIALKHMNFTPEEWDAMNALSDKKFEARQRNQQLIDNTQEMMLHAETLLHSDQWYDLVTGLALATGRRLTELLKTGQFFPKSAYTLVFDGQLKRRDIVLQPYEIPVLFPAEIVLVAWRRLRGLIDCTSLNIDEVAVKYSREASESAKRHFTGIIPQRSARSNLYTHALRAVYARMAVLFFCPFQTDEWLYVNTILGQFQAKNKRQIRDFLTTAHYMDYLIGDGSGQIDGRRGIRLGEPGIEVLEIFQPKEDQPMIATETEHTQHTQGSQQPVLETKKAKKRGMLTTRPGTFEQARALMRMRNMHRHDEIVVDMMAHDAVAHQMYALLVPLTEELVADGPLAILQALVAAYRNFKARDTCIEELLQEVSEEKEPVVYLRGLVERDRNFKAALARRHAETDYSSLPMSELERIKTTEAAIERFRRAVDSIIAHNNAQQDPLHLWYINAAIVRDLVGGRNDAVQVYLEKRKDEIEAHHQQFNLTPRQNRKPIKIEQQISVQ
jgi:hypothetical protein